MSAEQQSQIGTSPLITPKETFGEAEQQPTLQTTRGEVGTTLAEHFSFINVREIEDWCKDARTHRPRAITATAGFGVGGSLLLGFIPALESTDLHEHGVWYGAFLVGALVGAAILVISTLVLIVQIPFLSARLRDWGLMGEMTPSPLERLAERMEAACEKGLPIAAAATEALAREEREKEKGAK